MFRIGDNEYEDAEDAAEELSVHIVAIAYYIYRHAGCPMGEGLDAFNLWANVNLWAPFEAIAEGEFDG